MKKIILSTLVSAVFTSSVVFAAESNLMDIRNKVMGESQAIKDLYVKTKDVILVTSMWDSCMITMSQLDAYFSQLGIFDTIKKEEISAAAIDFLVNWLKEIKATDDLNIKSLSSVTGNIEAESKLHLEALKGDYTDLNAQIDKELDKLDALKKVVAQKK